MRQLGSHDYVQSLKGQTLRFPDIDGLFKHWPTGFNPHYEVLRQVQDAELYKLLGPGKRYEALLAADCAFHSASWWPNATFDSLRVVSALVAFLYIWDNEIDSPEFSNISSDLDAGEGFRERTIEHMRKYLAEELPERGVRSEQVEMAIASFNPVGEAVGFRLSRLQRKLFLEENIRFVRATGDEQRMELGGRAPSIDDYMQIRMGTSGVAALSALTEYMMQVDLGDEIRNDPDIQSIYKENNSIISLVNDIFSLRKELAFPFYCNAVAVLYHEHRSLQTAVDETYRLVATSVLNLEVAAERLFQKYPDRRNDLEGFVYAAKTMCTGNITWSRMTRRYKLGIDRFDGTTSITL
ncbi:hypothetical protein H072_2687 [Dactylellina haptotyla CBS 200.50]|uniref:Terpene synthase n=1 Tax=Dactylellina haptotyla (strain CBS 200.50) TaxID=1284197 RepID=S8AK82_DACHA|nr:hypothetical protein H072_2687 [Dactylellina haptotyla CBS 200.50]